MFFSRREMTVLAADRELQAARALAAAGGFEPASSEARMAAECAAELRDHADQLRRGINPYEADHSLWIPRGDGL
ncbi:hypothetical protein [Streptomyces sp. NPDC056670]|uniref:hypothetical protein n=1 Tax=Streptomyces sp. NPDC056670 TaxID=3345904 RepID=UPI003696D6B7